MTGREKTATTLTKIFIGVAIAVLSAIIINSFDFTSNESNNSFEENYQPSTEYSEPEEIDYSKYLGIYKGVSTNTIRFTKGNTIVAIKELNNSTKKAIIEILWYEGLTGEGRLHGRIDKQRVEVQGRIHSDISGEWDIELEIILNSNLENISGTYKLFPLPGNPNGTQNGKFNLSKEI